MDAFLWMHHAFSPSERDGLNNPQFPVRVVLIDAPSDTWKPYVKIIDDLSSAKVSAIVLDFAFVSNLWDRIEARSALLASLTNALNADHGLKIIIGALGEWRKNGNAFEAHQEYPFDALRDFIELHSNRCALGILNAASVGSGENTVRFYHPDPGFPSKSLASVAAKFINGKKMGTVGREDFLINYLRSPGTLIWTNLVGQEPGTALENKVVFVGASERWGDFHRVPFTRWSGRRASGAEIHATAYMNLLSALDKPGIIVPSRLPSAIVVGMVGIFLGLGFLRLSPTHPALMVLLLISPAVIAGMVAGCAFFKWNLLLPWWITAGPQTLAAVIVSFVPVKSVFISHKSDGGKNYARLFANGFRQLGIEVFMDEEHNKSGSIASYFANRVLERGNFVLLITRELYCCSQFTRNDFRNMDSFVDKLRRSQDPVSTYLRSRLSPATLKAIDRCEEGSSPANRDLLLEDMNRLIREHLIFEEHRFAAVEPRERTRELLARHPASEELAFVNKALLEDAYPGEIFRQDYWFIFDEISTAQMSSRNIVPVIVDVERWGLKVNGVGVTGNDIDSWARKWWAFGSGLRIFRYEERTGPERIREIARCLKWSPLRHIFFSKPAPK